MSRLSSAVAALLVAGSLSAPTLAQDQQPAAAGGDAARSLSLELNNLAQADTACRVTFMATNGMGVAIEELAVEIVLFDQDQHASNFLVLKTGRLPEGKSRVRQFDLPNLDCGTVSSILVNDVTECSGAGLTAPACLDALSTSTKASIALDL